MHFLFLFQKALPVPMKAFHHYNTGPIFDILLSILKPTLPEKMRIRVRKFRTLDKREYLVIIWDIFAYSA